MRLLKLKAKTSTSDSPTIVVPNEVATTTLPSTKISSSSCSIGASAMCREICSKINETIFSANERIRFSTIDITLAGIDGLLLLILIALVVYYFVKLKSKSDANENSPTVDMDRSTRMMAQPMDPATNALLSNPVYMAKYNAFKEARDKEYAEDVKQINQAKKSTIYIPNEINDIDLVARVSNRDINLDKVFYDPKNNEQFEIGSDVDEVELEPSTMATIATSVMDSAMTKTKGGSC
ncbi:unnamed protein product [Caenorhabditis bovis]|uniref:Uncharacterized protein n=1 Tax=Caenorhabditis bovis TaxID=2654633 RepID=A0A8S1F452_9PELO|nr:unnamed protein product [Caenorhabditis bovis]